VCTYHLNFWSNESSLAARRNVQKRKLRMLREIQSKWPTPYIRPYSENPPKKLQRASPPFLCLEVFNVSPDLIRELKRCSYYDLSFFFSRARSPNPIPKKDQPFLHFRVLDVVAVYRLTPLRTDRTYPLPPKHSHPTLRLLLNFFDFVNVDP